MTDLISLFNNFKMIGLFLMFIGHFIKFIMQFLSKYRFAFTYPCPRKLREIMQMSLIERENKDNIVKIWMDYHKERDQNIAYIVSKTEYQLLQHNAKSSPLFLLPLKRKAGHFVLIG